MHPNPTALVTGASRGIGKATAIALARQGFDLIISARTVTKKERYHDIPLSGSLEETGEEIVALGRKVLTVPMDLVKAGDVEACWEKVMSVWGRVDVLVNNAIYQGAGLLKRVTDLHPDELLEVFQGNVFAPVRMTQLALEHMRSGKGGRIINMVSASAMVAPTRPVDDGGWSFQYAASKAALQQLALVLRVELSSDSIQIFNVEPGFIFTEMMKEKGMDEAFAKQWGGAPVTVPAAVIAWLATADAAREFNGKTVHAQKFALQRELHEDWHEKTSGS